MRVGPSFREGPGPTRDQRHAKKHDGGVCFPYGTPDRRGAGAEAAATLRHIAGAMPARHVGERPAAVLRETSMEEKLDRLFHLKEHGTTVKTEVLAGLTTFVTAAYVLAVNPSVMSATGMDAGAVFTATALVCFLGTLAMALLTNYPFVLVPSMGLNAYFAYTVVLGMGYS